MAFVVGEQVAYHQPVANAEYAQRDGNFLFGVVVDATNVDVLWSNGTFAEGIAVAALDRIGTVADPPNAGKFVAIAGASSPSYRGILVRTYTRDQSGDGSIDGTYSLVRLEGGQLVEAVAAQVTEVVGS